MIFCHMSPIDQRNLDEFTLFPPQPTTAAATQLARWQRRLPCAVPTALTQLQEPFTALEGRPRAVSVKRFGTGASAPACNRIALSRRQGDNGYIVQFVDKMLTLGKTRASSFLLSLNRIFGCVLAKKRRNFVFHRVLRSACTIFL